MHIQSAKTRTNREWIDKLVTPGSPDQEVLQELRELLKRGLQAPLAGKIEQNRDEIIEEMADRALQRILEKKNAFRGESKFLTWSMKIAVREGFYLLRKEKRVGKPDESRADAVERSRASTLVKLEKAIREVEENDLTAVEGNVMNFVLGEEMSIGAVAETLQTDRNTIYTVMNQVRRKLKRGLEKRGINVDQALQYLQNSELDDEV